MSTRGLLTLGCAALPVANASAQAPADTAVVVASGAITWQPAPPVLEPGAQAANLAGDPSQPGLIALRVRVPDQYRIAPHRHSVAEHVTVLSGTLCFALGAQATPDQARCVGAGGFARIPAHTAHSVWALGPTEYQIQAVAPFDMTYLNPGADPSRRRP
jgi:quercetin dioxygenase-like cupin family protein